MHHRGVLGFHVPDLSYPLDKATERLARAQSLGREQLPGQAKELVEEVKGIYLRSYERMREVAFPGDPKAGQSVVEPSTSWFLGTGLHINAMPPELLLAFLTTPHEKMFTVSTLIEAMGWGIEIYGIEPPRVLSEGLLKFACINVAAVRCLFTPEGECYDSFRAMQGGKGLAGIIQSQTNIDLAFKAQALMISTVPGAADYLVPRYKTGWRELPPVKPEDIVRLIAFGLTEAPPPLGRSELY